MLVSPRTDIRVVSYNSRGLRLGQGAGDKAQRFVSDKLMENTDILCLQETFLAKQDLDRLNSVNDDFHGAGESTTNLSTGMQRGRIPGGVAIFWHKRYDPLITVIRLDVDWAIAIKVEHNDRAFVVLNMYTPYESTKNEDEYISRLGFISSFIMQSAYTSIVGDMNAEISDNSSMFGQHLLRFCEDNKLVLSSKVLLPMDSFTYTSEAWHTTSWLDHCVCTADAHGCIERMDIMYEMATSDHIPVSFVVNAMNLPELSSHENNVQTGKID